MQYFGLEDSVINTTAVIHDNIVEKGEFKFHENGMIGLNKRFFTVQCVTSTESLIFPFAEIDKFKKDFKISSTEFLKD